jgi:hypothetical protein
MSGLLHGLSLSKGWSSLRCLKVRKENPRRRSTEITIGAGVCFAVNHPITYWIAYTVSCCRVDKHSCKVYVTQLSLFGCSWCAHVLQCMRTASTEQYLGHPSLFVPFPALVYGNFVLFSLLIWTNVHWVRMLSYGEIAAPEPCICTRFDCISILSDLAPSQ